MSYLKLYLTFIKSNKDVIKFLKLIMLLIINLWLLIIFWKILLVNDELIINNNKVLIKISNMVEPALNMLGLDILTPNMFKMLVITSVIVVSNLAILHFNQMLGLLLLAFLGKYSYKSYTNYLINSENLSYMGFEDKNLLNNIVESIAEPEPEPQTVVIENIISDEAEVIVEAAYHTHWGVWVAVGLGLVVCFGLLVYAHGQGWNDSDINSSSLNVNSNIIKVDNKIDNINQKIEQVTNDLNINNQKIEQVTNDLNINNQKIEQVTNGFNINNQKIEQVTNDLNINNQKIEQVTNGFNINNQKIEQVTNGFNINNQNLEQVTNDLSINNQKILDLGQVTNDLSNSINIVSNNISLVAKNFDKKIKLMGEFVQDQIITLNQVGHLAGETSSTAEATAKGFNKLLEIVADYKARLQVMEVKIESLQNIKDLKNKD